MGSRPIVVVADPELLREVCVRKAASFPARMTPTSSLPRRSEAFRGVALGLVFADGGAYWRAARAACLPLFQPTAVAAAATRMVASADELVDALMRIAHADGGDGTADVAALLGNMTLDVVGGCALGAHMGAQAAAAARAPAAPLVAAVNTVFASLEPVSGSGRLHDPWALAMMLSPRCLAPLWRAAAAVAPARVVARLLAADTYVREESKRLLAQQRARTKQQEDGHDFSEAHHAPPAPREQQQQQEKEDAHACLSLFSLLCGSGAADAARRHGVPPLSDEQVVAQAHVMLLAGVETTANALCHTLYLLALHPDAAARVRAEADACTAPPSAADVAAGRFAFTHAALQEALRLMPVVPLLSRVAACDATVGGARIPAGTPLLLPLTRALRDAAQFPQPHAFRPERFLPPAEAQGAEASAAAVARHPLAFAPFGAGPRQCIGARFATCEAVLTLARLFRALELALPPGAPPLALREGITCGPAAGLRLRVTQRRKEHAHAAAALAM
jgi:cytochrome P450